MLAWSFSARTLDEVGALLRAMGRHRYVREADHALHWTVDEALSDRPPFAARAAAFRELRAKDPQWFEDKVYEVHQNVMTTIAEMIARNDPGGHCGLCHGGCVKDKLIAVNLDLNTLRGGTIQTYLTILDDLGLPGEKTIQWVGELPA